MKKNFAKKLIKRMSALLAGVVVLAGSSLTVHAEGKYTYCYDYWGEVQDSPDAYEVVKVFTSNELGLEKPISPTASGLTVIGNYIYLCDTGNNRIIVLERSGTDGFDVVREITEIKGRDRVEAVVVSAVDENLKPIPGTQ